jgi:GNAT superfamily N-acetyltransferase
MDGWDMDTNVHVRDARTDDAPAVDGVLRSFGWFDHLDEMPTADTQARIADTIARCSSAGDNTLLVAESHGGEVVGCLFVHWLPNLIFGGEGYVSELFVRLEARGRGAGSGLLEAAKRLGVERGCLRLTLFNRKERESYQRGFYPKQGWVERDDAALFMYYLQNVP